MVGALLIMAGMLDFPNSHYRLIRRRIMLNDLKCNYCFGTGQKVEMRSVKFGEKLPPYEPCSSCGGTGIAPKPVKVYRRKSMRRIV